MKFAVLLFLAVPLLAGPINLSNTPNPETAMFGRAESPSGAYSFWLTESALGYPVPIMDGPGGLIELGGSAWVDYHAGSLADDAGFAVLAVHSTGDPALFAFHYPTDSRRLLDVFNYDFGSGSRGAVSVGLVEPVSLVDGIFTGYVRTAEFWTNDGGTEILDFEARWSLSGGTATAVTAEAAHTPEPATWGLMAAALALGAGRHVRNDRLRRRAHRP